MTLRQHRKRLIKEVDKVERQIDFFNVEVFDYESVPEVLKLTEKDEGKRLWLADEPRTRVIKLKKFKSGGLEITYQGEKKYRACYEEEALLHPIELTEERLEKFGIQVKDGRKNA